MTSIKSLALGVSFIAMFVWSDQSIAIASAGSLEPANVISTHVGHTTQAASNDTSLTVVFWFNDLIELNPNCFVVINGTRIIVTSPTGSTLTLPPGPVPSTVHLS